MKARILGGEHVARGPRIVPIHDLCPVCGKRGPCVWWDVETVAGVFGGRRCLRWPPKTAAVRRRLVADLMAIGNKPPSPLSEDSGSAAPPVIDPAKKGGPANGKG